MPVTEPGSPKPEMVTSVRFRSSFRDIREGLLLWSQEGERQVIFALCRVHLRHHACDQNYLMNASGRATQEPPGLIVIQSAL